MVLGIQISNSFARDRISSLFTLVFNLFPNVTDPFIEFYLEVDGRTVQLTEGINAISLTSEFIFVPGQSYQLAMQISANGTVLVFDQNNQINPNPPVHYGREDNLNAPDPASGMLTNVTYSKSTRHPWIGVA